MAGDEGGDGGAEVVPISAEAHLARVTHQVYREVDRLRERFQLGERLSRRGVEADSTFDEIASRLLAIHRDLTDLGLVLDQRVRSSMQALSNAVAHPETEQLALALGAALKDTLQWLRNPPDPPSGGNGPLAAQMALRKK